MRAKSKLEVRIRSEARVCSEATAKGTTNGIVTSRA